MHAVFSVLANVLIILGGAGLLLLGAGAFPREVLDPWPPRAPFRATAWTWTADEAVAVVPPPGGPDSEDGSPPEGGAAEQQGLTATEAEPAGGEPAGITPLPVPSATAPPPTRTPSPAVTPVALMADLSAAPITRLRVPRIRLDSGVVPSQLVSWKGATTWEVPAFRVGHGVYTAGAGEAGNGVLIGHVSSLNLGNVFRDLERVRVGDQVQVFSEQQGFDYVVTDVRQVPRTDLAMLAPTPDAVVTLMTCTGEWLADIEDYSHRLTVRAKLVAAHPTATATPTPTPVASATPTPSATPEATEVPEVTETATATSVPPTAAATAAATASPTPSVTQVAGVAATPSNATPLQTPPPPAPTRTPGPTVAMTTTVGATPGSSPPPGGSPRPGGATPTVGR